jgi:hypothetical protein
VIVYVWDTTFEEDGTPVLFESTIVPMDYEEWILHVQRFAAVFGLLLDAENYPISIRDERSPALKKQPGFKQSRPPSWLTRHVYLSDAAIAQARAHDTASGTTDPGSDRDLAPVVV